MTQAMEYGYDIQIMECKELYRVGSLRTVSRELARHKLDLVGVQVRWEEGGTEPAGEYTFFYKKGNENHELGTGFFVHKGNISAVKRVEFVSDRMSYIILRGHWCYIKYTFFYRKGNENHELGTGFFVHKGNTSRVKRVEFVSDRMAYIILRGHWCYIMVLNVHAPIEDKIDDVKGSFYKELEHVFDKFLKYHMKILLGDFNAKTDGEDVLKPQIGNDSLHEISNGNGVRVVNFATSKNLSQKSTIFPHHNIYNYTWTSPDGKPAISLTIF
jgi:exonuclease III